MLTNSPRAEPLAHEIFDTVLRDLAGVETTPRPVPPARPAPLDADRVCGTYRTTRYDLTLTVENDRAFLIRTETGKPTARVEVVRLGAATIITTEPTADGHQVLSLLGADAHGRAQVLHNGTAAHRIA